jgi:hypothetical protein
MNLKPDHMARLAWTIRRTAPSESDAAFKFAADMLRGIPDPDDGDIAETCAQVMERFGIRRPTT